MLNTTNSNSEYLHNYIRKVAKHEQESVDTSNVYTGTIEATQSGIYTIVLNQSDKSSSVLAIPIVTGDVYDKNDSVYLLRANTTSTANYFIVGKVNAIQEAFFNLTDLERFNPDESKVDLSFGSNNFISIGENKNNIFDNISNLGYFQLEVEITSQVEDDAKIIIYLNYEDEGRYKAEFVFSSYEFIGQPGGASYSLIQKKIFHLPSNIIIENIRIEKVGDFSVGAMNIVAGSLLEVSAAYQNNIVVQNDKNYFEKDIEIEDDYTLPNTITLTSKVYYNNKPLVGDVLQYYWFLKDDSAVDSESSDYLNIEGAGNGWRCLNTFTSATTADGQEIRLWDNKNNFIALNKTNESVNFSNFVNKVKCIVKYFDNFIESDLIDIYNYENENFTINLNASSNIIVDAADKVTLTCEVLNDGEKIDLNQYSLEYQWYKKTAVAAEGENITPKIVEEGVEDKEITKYSSFYIYDFNYPSTDTPENGYKLGETEQKLSFYCEVTIIPLKGKSRYEESSNEITIETVASDSELTQNIEYKYYIATHSKVKFQEESKTVEGKGTYNTGDWKIIDKEVDSENWLWLPNESIYDEEGNYEVFYDLNIFEGKVIKEEYFVYYTQRKIWKQNGQNIKAEDWARPQIARSVIHTTRDGWKNYRADNSITQLNTFNQLTNNGADDGIYYADLGQLTQDENPDPSKTYYTKDTDGTYKPVQLNITWDFERDKDGKLKEYYKWDSEEEKYIQVVDIEGQPAEYDSNITYYKKDGDDYRKLEVNLNNFKAVNTAWPENITNPTQEVYENIDNKLFINATYIRSGTLEVEDKFYASIDQDEVRIAGFNVNETILESNNETVGLNSDDSQKTNIAIWAGEKSDGASNYPFQVNHQGQLIAIDGIFTGEIKSENLKYDSNNNVLQGGVISFKDIPYLKFKDFQIDQNGAITATSGTIGGFHITNDHLGSGDYESNNDTANDLVMLSPGLANGGYVFWAGNKSENGDDSTRPFWIKNDGSFKANDGTIADWTVEPYRLIGPSIQEQNDATAYPRVGMSAASGYGSWAFWAGGHPDENGEGVAYGSKSKFHVGHSGELYADTAYITNQGQIGVFSLKDGYLETSNLRFGDFRDTGTDEPVIGLLMRNKDKINLSWEESGSDLQLYADKDMNSIIPNLKTINLHATSLSVNSFTAPGGIIFGKHRGYPCLGIGSINMTKGMAIGIRFVSLGLNSGNLRLYISPTGNANNNKPTGFTTYVKLYYNDFSPVDNRRILGPQEDIIIKVRYVAAADSDTRDKEIKFSSLLSGSEWYDSSVEYVVQSDTVSTDWTRKGIKEIVITELSWYSYSENKKIYFDTNAFYINWVDSPGSYSGNYLTLTDVVKKDSDYRLEAFKQDDNGNVTTAVILG